MKSEILNPHMRNFLLSAYLNRELDADTEAEFELELLADPELADAAAGDTGLLLGLSRVETLATPAPEPAIEKMVVMPPRRKSRPWLALAAAASALMLIAGSLGYFFKPAPTIQGGAQLAYIDKQRSQGHGIQIKLPKTGPLVLMVPVASVGPCVADIAISQSGKSIRASATPDDFGYAVVVLAMQALKPGPANVEVACAGKSVGQYSVLVVR